MIKLEVFCNKCGSLQKDNEEWFHWKNQWGYGGVADMREDSIDLCHNCYDLIISAFIIKPWD